MIKRLLISAAVFCAPLQLSAQDAESEIEIPELTLQERTSLRCGIAFGLIAKGQAEGEAAAAEYPPMEPRGREFFVRTMATLMDAHTLTREQVGKLAFDETMELMNQPLEDREAMMPACLLLLDASGV